MRVIANIKTDLRPATPADQELARRIHHAAYREVVTRQFGGWDEAMQDGFFLKEWQPSEIHFVRAEGREIGIIQRRVHADHIEIAELQILPEFQGKGIGSRLIRAEIDAANRAGLPLKLQVLKENRAQHLYRRLGFEDTGSTDTHIIMWRQASGPLAG